MAQKKLNIDCIWWRNVQVGEFYNIERHHQIEGGGGALYIEIPSSMVRTTLDFLDEPNANPEAPPTIAIQAGVIGPSSEIGTLEFQPKAGKRMRIARQNRQMPASQRHPAWTARYGFPSAPDDVRDRAEAEPYFPEGGLRIYIAKTIEGEFFAGHTKGPRPEGMKANHPMWNLYPEGRVVGGVIEGGGQT